MQPAEPWLELWARLAGAASPRLMIHRKEPYIKFICLRQDGNDIVCHPPGTGIHAGVGFRRGERSDRIRAARRAGAQAPYTDRRFVLCPVFSRGRCPRPDASGRVRLVGAPLRKAQMRDANGTAANNGMQIRQAAHCGPKTMLLQARTRRGSLRGSPPRRIHPVYCAVVWRIHPYWCPRRCDTRISAFAMVMSELKQRVWRSGFSA
jgi:hypothetical protein